MDGPSVNLLFQQKLETTLQERDEVLIDVGTCPLHIASNAFCEGLKILSADFQIDLDQIVLDLYRFFKYFTHRIHDYFNVETFTELQGHRMLKHLLTRWISIKDVLIQVLGQFSNLKKYYLQILPEQRGFKGKSGIGPSERYIHIKTALTDKKLPSIVATVVYIAKDFRNFMVPLQDKLRMITDLYPKMVTFKDTLSKFIVEENYLLPSKSLKSIHKLQKLDLNKDPIQKALFSLICYERFKFLVY